MGKVIIHVYATNTGKRPFNEWLYSLDEKVRSIIIGRLDRVEMDNFGDCKRIIGSNIWELRIMFGAGYRVYFGKRGSEIVVLLAGGDKSSQLRDIEKAKRYWLDFLGK